MRAVGPSISAHIRFSTIGRYGSKSYMNLSVSWIDHNDKLSRSIAFMLGLLQGGEFVTARARALVKGALQHSFHRPDTEPGTREAEGFKLRHPRGPGGILTEVRRRRKEGLFKRPDSSIHQIWLPEGQRSQVWNQGWEIDADWVGPHSLHKRIDTQIFAHIAQKFLGSSNTLFNPSWTRLGIISANASPPIRFVCLENLELSSLIWTQTAFLVGGFATSPWLSEQLEKRLLNIRLKICKPDTQT
jgi:hypothetical protein